MLVSSLFRSQWRSIARCRGGDAPSSGREAGGGELQPQISSMLRPRHTASVPFIPAPSLVWGHGARLRARERFVQVGRLELSFSRTERLADPRMSLRPFHGSAAIVQAPRNATAES